MAKKYEQSHIGISNIRNIMPVTTSAGKGYGAMTEAELTPIYKEAIKAANQRIRRVEKSPAGAYSSALNARRDEEGNVERFKYSQDMTLNEMRKEFGKVQKFLGMKSTSIKGAKEVQKSFEEAGFTEDVMKSDEFRAFDSIFEAISDDFPDVKRFYGMGATRDSARIEMYKDFSSLVDKGMYKKELDAILAAKDERRRLMAEAKRTGKKIDLPPIPVHGTKILDAMRNATNTYYENKAKGRHR